MFLSITCNSQVSLKKMTVIWIFVLSQVVVYKHVWRHHLTPLRYQASNNMLDCGRHLFRVTACFSGEGERGMPMSVWYLNCSFQSEILLRFKENMNQTRKIKIITCIMSKYHLLLILSALDICTGNIVGQNFRITWPQWVNIKKTGVPALTQYSDSKLEKHTSNIFRKLKTLFPENDFFSINYVVNIKLIKLIKLT